MPVSSRQGAKAARRRPAILVPLDGSSASRRALGQAIAFARRLRASVVALHVVTPYEIALYTRRRPAVTTPDAFAKDATRVAERILSGARMTARSAGVPCVCRIVWESTVVDSILRTARADRCGLIVMAAHGRTGLQRILLGSITQKVLAATRVPVMVLPLRS